MCALPVFNYARGRIAYFCSLPGSNSALQAVLFKAASQSVDSTMMDFTSLSQIKGSNTEADFTGYTRKVISGLVSPGQGSIVPDYVGDTLSIDCNDITWTAAGGTTNNNLGRIVFVYNPDTTAGANDTNCIPLIFNNFVTTTDGTDRTAQINTAGFWKSA